MTCSRLTRSLMILGNCVIDRCVLRALKSIKVLPKDNDSMKWLLCPAHVPDVCPPSPVLPGRLVLSITIRTVPKVSYSKKNFFQKAAYCTGRISVCQMHILPVTHQKPAVWVPFTTLLHLQQALLGHALKLQSTWSLTCCCCSVHLYKANVRESTSLQQMAAGDILWRM